MPVVAPFFTFDTLGFFQGCTLRTKNNQPVFCLACLAQYILLIFLIIVGKKDGDDGTADVVDIPKRTTPAKGTFSPSSHSQLMNALVF